ncbi:MAG: hypothetical protein TU35_000305 [Thermoproteus sp. AZ2]|jgi:hypothetical protein|uniref:Uncharacterized protein n=1 Tax=Thermoproteus sp. AZ2 TaxID=1609232 RepID=A0ACC6UYE9_9CREN
MGCVGEEEAVKAARRAALGALASLRRGEAIAVRIGEDWLVGFYKVKHSGSETRLEFKWAYVDCKGVAFGELPQDAAAALESLLGAIPDIIKRELESRSGGVKTQKA